MTSRTVEPPGAESDYGSLVRDDRIHRTLYTDPAVFADEMERIFGRTWVYLGHESEIPEPHDFKLTSLGTRPVILSRDSEGTARAFFNRCSHRGVTVCNEERGNASRFVCSYHGWTYSSSGELLNVPFPSGVGDSFDLGEWDCTTWIGSSHTGGSSSASYPPRPHRSLSISVPRPP